MHIHHLCCLSPFSVEPIDHGGTSGSWMMRQGEGKEIRCTPHQLPLMDNDQVPPQAKQRLQPRPHLSPIKQPHKSFCPLFCYYCEFSHQTKQGRGQQPRECQHQQQQQRRGRQLQQWAPRGPQLMFNIDMLESQAALCLQPGQQGQWHQQQHQQQFFALWDIPLWWGVFELYFWCVNSVLSLLSTLIDQVLSSILYCSLFIVGLL